MVAFGSHVDQRARRRGGTSLGHQRHNTGGGCDGEWDLGSEQLLEYGCVRGFEFVELGDHLE